MASKVDEHAVDRRETIADVLAHDDGKYWFQKPHLLRLNFLLTVPLLSSAISGYDVCLHLGCGSLSTRDQQHASVSTDIVLLGLLDEWPPVFEPLDFGLQ